MSDTRYKCNYDAIVEMQKSQVGPQEILQYSLALLADDQIEEVLRGLEAILQERAGTSAASVDPQLAL